MRIKESNQNRSEGQYPTNDHIVSITIFKVKVYVDLLFDRNHVNHITDEHLNSE